MDLIDIILLAIALGVDCLVVSFSQGLIFTSQRTKNSLRLALCMGLFQGLMPIIGYIGAHKIYDILIPYSRWIVFGIFFILGLHFILEAFQEKVREQICRIGLRCLIGFGIATSIDALISGVSLRLTAANLILACSIIGVVSFVMSLAGFWSGNRFKSFPSKYLEITGGLILLALAVKSALV